MTFKEAFAAARAAGLPDFEYKGKRYTTQLAGESKKRKPETKVKKEVEALIPNLPKTEELEPNLPKTEELDYPGTDVPYKYRGLADVEFRADIDPIISGVPPALLKYQDIEQKTGGDVGELIKVILGEDDPNNPGLFRESRGTLGRYIPAEGERYYKKDNLGEPGVSYAFEPDTSEFDSDRLVETIVEELGHGGMRILENTVPEQSLLQKLRSIMTGKEPETYNPIVASEYGFPEKDSTELALEEEIMDQYQYRARENDPEVSRDVIGGRSNLNPKSSRNVRMLTNMLNRIDEQSLEELRRRGRVSIPFTSTEVPEESFFEKFTRRLRGGAEPKLPLTRYAQGGIASIRKA